MTSCIDYCDKACQHLRLMRQCCAALVPLYIFELSSCKALGSTQHAAAFLPHKNQHASLLERRHSPHSPLVRLAQLSDSLAPTLYEFVACCLKHFKCIN